MDDEMKKPFGLTMVVNGGRQADSLPFYSSESFGRRSSNPLPFPYGLPKVHHKFFHSKTSLPTFASFHSNPFSRPTIPINSMPFRHIRLNMHSMVTSAVI
jgi:hypothetical protein